MLAALLFPLLLLILYATRRIHRLKAGRGAMKEGRFTNGTPKSLDHKFITEDVPTGPLVSCILTGTIR